MNVATATNAENANINIVLDPIPDLKHSTHDE